jgi:hypothetical protein
MKMSGNFKNSLIIIVAVLGVILMGLFFYEKTVSEKVAQENSPEVSNEKTSELNLPQPTGKTNDIMEAALSGLEVELKMESSEESLVQNVLDDQKEVSAFSSAYENASF